MRPGSTSGILRVTAAFVFALALDPAPAPLRAAECSEPPDAEDPPRATGLAAIASWEDFVTLEVGEDELILTNVSDRPIVAWTVRTVVRYSEGNEGWSGTGTDAFRRSSLTGTEGGVLQPGESVTVDKGQEPQVPEHLQGPEFRVYHDVGALVFENAEWVGVPGVVDRIFQSRLNRARAAWKAVEVTASATAADVGVLNELPRWYRWDPDSYATPSEALRTINAQALEDYEAAVANLRPEDLAELRLEKDPPLYAMQMEPLPEIPRPPKPASEEPSPEDFARLEVRETDLLLTNLSDRPINAWAIKAVMRSSQERESWGATLTDAYRSPILPIGEERLLQPGESIGIEKGEQPPLGEDYRGPGAGVYYVIGALIFESGDAVGDPKLVESIFESRLEWARSALKALEVVEVAASAEPGEAIVPAELIPYYRRYLEMHGDRRKALLSIRDQALEEYRIAVANLRAEDLEKLLRLEGG